MEKQFHYIASVVLKDLNDNYCTGCSEDLKEKYKILRALYSLFFYYSERLDKESKAKETIDKITSLIKINLLS